MPCTLTSINQDNASCGTSDGGIKQSYGIDLSTVDALTYDGSNGSLVTGVTLSGVGEAFTLYVYDDDDSAFYNEEGERTGKKHVYNQQASMKFEGITAAKIQAAEQLKDCCAQFWFHVGNNGIIRIQGVEKSAAASGFDRPKQTAKATVSINSLTGADADNITIVIDSQAKVALVTDLTTTEIEALVGT
jgi:hypothetical protein